MWFRSVKIQAAHACTLDAGRTVDIGLSLRPHSGKPAGGWRPWGIQQFLEVWVPSRSDSAGLARGFMQPAHRVSMSREDRLST